MARRAHNPYIPVGDGERLTRAAHVLKAAIVAIDAKHVNTYQMLQPGKSMNIHLSHPVECAYSLIQEVLEHRRDLQRVIARRDVPEGGPRSVTWQLLQILHVLKVAIYAYESEPEPIDGIDFSYPLWAAVRLIEEASEGVGHESDKEFVRRNPKLMREVELMRTPPASPASIEGKPN
jgi:hypothetical protein